MTLQLIDVFSIACLIATTVLFYYILRPTKTNMFDGYGIGMLIEIQQRGLLLIPVLAIWAVYFFVRWIFKI